jgi:hypothetical protein
MESLIESTFVDELLSEGAETPTLSDRRLHDGRHRASNDLERGIEQETVDEIAILAHERLRIGSHVTSPDDSPQSALRTIEQPRKRITKGASHRGREQMSMCTKVLDIGDCFTTGCRADRCGEIMEKIGVPPVREEYFTALCYKGAQVVTDTVGIGRKDSCIGQQSWGGRPEDRE